MMRRPNPSPSSSHNDQTTTSVGPASSTSSPLESTFWFNFWERWRSWVLCAVVGLFTLVFVYQGLQLWESLRVQRVQRAFLAALDKESDLLAFAHEHPTVPLGGVAYLAAADAAYAEGDFTLAASRYESAAEALSGTPLGTRAQLGQGASLLQKGDSVSGTPILEAVATDPSALVALSAQAAYLLALQALEENSFEIYDQRLALLEQLPGNTHLWLNKLRLLSDSLPDFHQRTAASSEATPPLD